MQEEIKELENKLSNCFYEKLQIEARIKYLKRNLQYQIEDNHGDVQKTNDTYSR